MTLRKLHDEELESLEKAQEKSLELTYPEWVKWMRDTYNYAHVYRMALTVGAGKPGIHFYHKLQDRARKANKIPSSVCELHEL